VLQLALHGTPSLRSCPVFKDVVWAAERGQPRDAEGQGTAPSLPGWLCWLRLRGRCGLVGARRLSLLFGAFVLQESERAELELRNKPG